MNQNRQDKGVGIQAIRLSHFIGLHVDLFHCKKSIPINTQGQANDMWNSIYHRKHVLRLMHCSLSKFITKGGNLNE